MRERIAIPLSTIQRPRFSGTSARPYSKITWNITGFPRPSLNSTLSELCAGVT